MYFRYYGKIVFKTIIWTAILTGLIVAMAWFVMWFVSSVFPQLKVGLWSKLLSLIVTTTTIIKFHDVFLRYPFKKTFTARRIINAPLEIVWNQVRPRAGNKPYNILNSYIRKVGDDLYRYYVANNEGLEEDFVDVKLIHEVPYQVLEMGYAYEDSRHDLFKTSRGFVYKFKSINEDQTEIMVRDVHDKPSLFTFYAFEFMGAHRDDFRQLASACEGQVNISWASAQTAMEELASHPDATWGDMLRPIGDGALIAITVLITAVATVSVWIF